jgi:hypothetical protein
MLAGILKDILHNLFLHHFSILDICILSRVCKRFHDISNSQILWNHHLRAFPEKKRTKEKAIDIFIATFVLEDLFDIENPLCILLKKGLPLRCVQRNFETIFQNEFPKIESQFKPIQRYVPNPNKYDIKTIDYWQYLIRWCFDVIEFKIKSDKLNLIVHTPHSFYSTKSNIDIPCYIFTQLLKRLCLIHFPPRKVSSHLLQPMFGFTVDENTSISEAQGDKERLYYHIVQTGFRKAKRKLAHQGVHPRLLKKIKLTVTREDMEKYINKNKETIEQIIEVQLEAFHKQSIKKRRITLFTIS